MPEAQLKVVLLACEVERLHTLNYNLTKENEIIKAQPGKSDRESDLETKLAIVLAENEKLNQIVEELYNVHAREKDPTTNGDYERRIADLLQDLDLWKQKYNKDVSHQTPNNLKETVEDLQREREALKEQLRRQGRDLEALRAHLSQIQVGSSDSKAAKEELSIVEIENNTLRSQLEAMKLKYGNADALQSKLNQYDQSLRALLAENDRLTNALAKKARDTQAHEREISVVLQKPDKNEGSKRAAPVASTPSGVLQIQPISDDMREKFNRITSENHRLNNLVIELRSENEKYRGEPTVSGKDQKVEQLTNQLNVLLDENRRLNDAVVAITTDNENLVRRVGDLEAGANNVNSINTRARQLVSENERLNALIYELRADGDKVKRQVEALTSQTSNLLEENRRLNEALADRLRESDGLRIKIRDLEALSQAESERLRSQSVDTSRVNQLTGQINSLVGENRRLNELLGGRSNELENQRRKIVELEAALVSHNDHQRQLRDKHSALASDIERLNTLIVELRRENDSLKVQVNESRNRSARLEQLNSQVNSLLGENRGFNETLHTKLREIAELKERLVSLEASSTTIGDLKNSIGLLSDDNERLNVTNRELKARLLGLEGSSAQIADLNNRIKYLSGDNDRLNRTIAERLSLSSQVEDSRSKVLVLTQDNEKLSSLLQEKTKELDATRNRLYTLEGSINQSSGLEERLRASNSEKDRLNTLLLDSLREVETLKQQIVDLQRGSGAIESYKANITLLSTENERLNSLLISNLKEIDTLRIKALQFESHRTVVNELHVRIEGLTRELDGLRRVNAEKSNNIEQLRKKSVGDQSLELKTRVEVLLTENERLNSLLDDKMREAEALRFKAGETERSAGRRSSQVTSDITRLNDDNQRLRESLANDQVKFAAERFAYETQILQLQQANADLRVQVERLSSEHHKRHAQDVSSTEFETLKREYNLVKETQNLQVGRLKAQIEAYKAISYVRALIRT